MVHYAHTLSQAWQCRVTLVHRIIAAVPSLTDEATRRTVLEQQEAEALEYMRHLVSSRFIFMNVDYVVTDTDLVMWLQNLDHTNFENWVITGLKSTGILKQIFWGSTTNQIIEHTDLPLIALPLEQEVPYPRCIALGLHEKYPFNEAMCRTMLSRFHGVEQLRLFTIVANGAEAEAAQHYLQSIADRFSDWELTLQVYEGSDIKEQMKAIAQEHPDTALMLQQGARSLSDLISRRFLINELVYHGKLPLIIIPHAADSN